ncbi:zinc finger protein 800b [Hippocampus zosterae]|uniref:zinc finger protein 800b n=1 Tax=Hippocampus zosterae TaxID=109293 RepID=UPI00223D4A69|nr:zinc finger protein 800b [Hippocampus zosterae]XP_051912083.1 zinc finger protein 800b [Hippocampus zosterae]
MVKTKSSGRKSSHTVRQESPQPDAEQSPHRVSDQPCTPAPTEEAAKKPPESPVDVQAKGDCSAQAKPLWRPIPPLLPEPDKVSAPDTGDQSCQTEDWLHQTAAGTHHAGHCVEPGDPPVLQQPLHTSKSGIHQIIECFRSGTSQLRHMLLREVDTIFECKVCRSLFRGLPNLITHKEYYCLSRLPEYDGDDRQSVAFQDLTDIIYHRADRQDYVVRLEPIQTSSKAMYQYLTTEEELARYPSRAPSARESPVAWEGETGEAENNQTAQPRGPESPTHSQGRKKWDAEEEEAKEEAPQPEDEGSTSGVEDVTISCCLCGQDFNSRRSIRRHCRKMHKTKLEELRKFTDTRTVPTSLLSMVKGRPQSLSAPPGKSCPVCLKVFATKTNVRRHFDEVHRGLRRDAITPAIASRPGQPLSLESTPPKKGGAASPPRSGNSKAGPINAKAALPNQNRAKPTSQPRNSAQPASRCTLCKRNYSSQLMLKRHMRIVHKIYSIKSNRLGTASASTTQTAHATNNNSGGRVLPSNNVQVKQEAVDHSEDEQEEDMDQSPPASPAQSTGSTKSAAAVPAALKVKEEETAWSPKAAAAATATLTGSQAAKSKLSVGFDFKQLFCKLCKRQFSSRQNLSKHIELHMDGNDIFIKFYRCPLCRYESRRKRDVLRHVTVVHKKSSPYLAKIMPKLESRAVKRLAEAVLNSANPKKAVGGGGKGEVDKRHATPAPSPCPPPLITRKQDGAASVSSPPPAAPARKTQEPPPPTPSPAPSPPVTRKQDRQQAHQPRPASPPMTRRSDKHSHHRNPSSASGPHTRRQDAPSESGVAGSSSTEVRVTKNFSLHACDQCGRAFAKKLYLESHKRSHRNAATAAASRRKGVSTRSKSLVW